MRYKLCLLFTKVMVQIFGIKGRFFMDYTCFVGCDKTLGSITLDELSQMAGYHYPIRTTQDLDQLLIMVNKDVAEELKAERKALEDMEPPIPIELENETKNDLLFQIKQFSLDVLAQEYGFQIETANDVRHVFSILYSDLKKYEKDLQNND